MRILVSSFVLVVLGSVVVGSIASTVSAQSVLLGKSDDGQRAYFSSTDGLFVRGWRGAPAGILRIGHGSEPRFDKAGNLFFTKVTDDGHHVLTRETWTVPSGDTTPRRLRADEIAPAYRLPAAPPESAAVKIAVDAGHGGTDPGATGNGLQEKAINLDIALRLKALLDLDTADTRGGGDWNVLMTRTTDVFISLSQRSNAANAFAAKTFLSIHNNAAGSSAASGSETYCYLGQEKNAGGLYRDRLHKELIAAWSLTNRGVKTANFHVLRETKMPASLIEGGFITNAGDAKTLGNANSRQRLALGLLWATQEHHGFSRYTPSSGPTPGTLRGVVYDVTRGTGTRIPGATVALTSGEFVASTATTAAFAFSLAPGTYRYGATAPGFEPATLVRTVTANQDVWGSLGLQPANVPALRGPAAVTAGASFTMTLAGDQGSPAFLMINTRPFLPPIRWGAFGDLWPDTRGAVFVGLGTIPSTGSLAIRIATPRTPGLRAHLQGLVRSLGVDRLTNGTAVQLN